MNTIKTYGIELKQPLEENSIALIILVEDSKEWIMFWYLAEKNEAQQMEKNGNNIISDSEHRKYNKFFKMIK